MKKETSSVRVENISYKLYKELASEICMPINGNEMTLQLRFEIYQSKLIYLRNISEQCFKSINNINQFKKFDYTIEDMVNIRNAIEITIEFMRQTIHESILQSVQIAQTKGLHASRFSKNNRCF